MYIRLCSGLALAYSLFAAANGVPGLIDAARRGDTASITAILKQGAEVNQPDQDGTTALH